MPLSTVSWPQLTLNDCLLTETVRRIEASGSLDDAEANRAASTDDAPTAQRIARRAHRLGERLGLQAELDRMRRWAPWVLLALVALVVALGIGAAGQVAGAGERRINIMGALVGLLGLHALTLMLWLVGLVVPQGTAGFSFGWIWLALTTRVAGGRQGQTPALVHGATGLLARARLLPWAFGLVSHAIWALSFAAVLMALAFALAVRQYTLTWETTILDTVFFVDAVRVIGWLPSLLGFPVPDEPSVLAAAGAQAGTAGQRAWALWLMGCVVSYGLLPRLASVAVSAAVVRARRSAMQPDWTAPYYRLLAARLDALRTPVVVDGDPGRATPPTFVTSAGPASGVPWLVGFELPDEEPWPPAGHALEAARAVRVDGSMAQRSVVLDALAQARPATVRIGCRAASSPDRGTERFVREVQALCGDCGLWLVGLPDADAVPARWRDWLVGAGLTTVSIGSVGRAAS